MSDTWTRTYLREYLRDCNFKLILPILCDLDPRPHGEKLRDPEKSIDLHTVELNFLDKKVELSTTVLTFDNIRQIYHEIEKYREVTR